MTQTREEFIETLPPSTGRISWSAMSSYIQCGETTWREELAWAAGFFDGEGTAYAGRRYTSRGKRIPDAEERYRPALSVAQKHREPLVRFQMAVCGLGSITLDKYGMYAWRVQNWRDVQTVMVMLWPFLGDVKREQILRMWGLCRPWLFVGRRWKVRPSQEAS